MEVTLAFIPRPQTDQRDSGDGDEQIGDCRYARQARKNAGFRLRLLTAPALDAD